jgi:hypothetical protein
MRRTTIPCALAVLLASLAVTASCAPDLVLPPEDVDVGVGDLTDDDFVPDTPSDPPADAGDSPAADDPADEPDDPVVPPVPDTTSKIVSGSVTRDAYRLIELGSAVAGDQYTISSTSFPTTGVFLIVLLDEQQDLLYRKIVSTYAPLSHIVRQDTAQLYLGVTPAYSSGGGSFEFKVLSDPGTAVPQPQAQVVWVNFGGGSNVTVNSHANMSFPAFDATRIGADYAGETGEMKAAILAALVEDYADYNLVVTTSDEGPPPSEPHSVVHLGGDDDALLGLADNVDQYNTDLEQNAIVFADAFAPYTVMGLTTAEMGQMVGNVVSHELGHLLGLYHTADPADVMDTTGTAWDLAADQTFLRGVLEESVFPTGYENCPARLLEILGPAPVDEQAASTVRWPTLSLSKKAQLRATVRQELRCRCGNCLAPDG